MDKKKIAAFTLLGKNYFLYLFRKHILRKQSPGYNEFIENYREDRIVPLTEAERDRHPDYTKCIVCELCDPVCPVLAAVGSEKFAGPMDIASCLSRDLTESGAWRDPFLSTLCGACGRACPESVPVSDMIVYLRRKTRITRPDKLPEFYRQAIVNLAANSTAFGKVPKQLSEAKSPILYWRGCREASSDSPITMKLLNFLGIDFMTVEEGCCGGLPFELGLEYDAAAVLGRIKNSGVKEIITGCMLCANFLKVSLPDVKVQFAADIIYNSAFTEKTPLLGKKAAFHDPCRAPRNSDAWGKPREVVRKLGAVPIQMPHEKEKAVCCGAGGGLMEVDLELAKKVARLRIDEAVDSGAEMLVTTCAVCAKNLSGAIENGENFKVLTLSEAIMLD